jgi:hypothetical protein
MPCHAAIRAVAEVSLFAAFRRCGRPDLAMSVRFGNAIETQRSCLVQSRPSHQPRLTARDAQLAPCPGGSHIIEQPGRC